MIADAPADDEQLVAALRRGDENAFATLLDRYHGALVGLAMAYVPNRAAAEDAAQETWLAVLRGIDGFEARSSLKTWIFRILTNQAMRRGRRESRSVPFSALAGHDDEPSVDPARFFPPGHEDAGHWSSPPRDRDGSPEGRLLAAETRAEIVRAIATLPPSQRAVVTLRDVDGCTAAEVCATLDLSEANQRVLLHRARSKVRSALERYWEVSQSA